MIKNLNIGDRVRCYPPLRLGTATVVYMFPAGIVPDPVLVDKYYQFKHGEPQYPGVYRAAPSDRWVLKRDSEDNAELYIIMPYSDRNFSMLSRFCDPMLTIQSEVRDGNKS